MKWTTIIWVVVKENNTKNIFHNIRTVTKNINLETYTNVLVHFKNFEGLLSTSFIYLMCPINCMLNFKYLYIQTSWNNFGVCHLDCLHSCAMFLPLAHGKRQIQVKLISCAIPFYLRIYSCLCFGVTVI